MDSLTLGQKIRNFRVRAGLSQMELEHKIGTSPGVVSRIEGGKVNPTKETLIDIIVALNLTEIEAAGLFGLDISSIITKLSKATQAINSSLELSKILQHSVDEICYEFNFLSGFITLVKGNRIYSQTTTTSLISKISLKVIPKKFSELYVDLDNSQGNLCARCVLERRVFVGDNMADFIVPAVNSKIAKLIIKLSGAKSCIVLPLIYEDKVIGTLMFGKNYFDDFSSERVILEEYAKQVAMAINKSMIYNN